MVQLKSFPIIHLIFLKDKDFQLEKWLLQTAYNHIDNDTFNFVKEDIANRK